ncbi:Thiamine precursor ECF transporter S component HmpT [uncultured Roseburia sp.]|uniref:ECF transporter S component n=1 Tax=Brotonthovivens ammoniilytica TaxID=2981725 RepID=A0ABT2TPP0_9FIRM|nr:ECF transporter S component [Brotonthovivens ammoniilytica]MCU6763751.1 ECF transporter S component [Brotonthovivens ammoniilytica]SCJ33708.1 Thiamine precursor ECF transporter S component HmpT [uncultured Roseburia sp.]
MEKTEKRGIQQIRFITVTAVFVALTYIFTACVNIRLPIAANGGLIHLGNIPLFVGAIIFGKRTGMIAGGVGMGLFDLLSGWTLWAPFTLVIVGFMGFAVGRITEKSSHQKFVWYTIAIAVACVIKAGGYYLAEGIIYGNWIAPAASIPGNLLQIGLAAVVTLAIVGRLNTAAKRIGLKEA